MPPIATFSIVAYDPDKKEWGVAVQSKFLAAAAVVSWARAGSGAVATQSYADLTYGERGLAMMKEGKSAEETIQALTANDEKLGLRQVGMVDASGQAHAFTGADCYDWAGHQIGEGFACQGNILIPGTVEAMAAQFEDSRKGEGELADWLVAALAAGQAAGGDSRGRQSAGVLVVREGGGYGGNNDRYLDLRVDDHPEPIQKLGELVQMHHLFFGDVDPENVVELAEVAQELQEIATHSGHYSGPVNGTIDEASRKAFRALVGNENLEERWDGSGDRIDQEVIKFLRKKYGK